MDVENESGQGSTRSGGSEDGDRRPMKNVSRERMKAETALLRSRVVDLERELTQMLAKKALERCLTPTPVWKDLAKRQAARREQSEEERNRLRAKLLHQIQVAKSLETIFRNRSGAFFEEICQSVPANGHQSYGVDDLAKLHETFMDEIDKIFPNIDTIFAEPVALQNSGEGAVGWSTVVTKHEGGEDKLYVELRDVNYVPFAFHRVCNATWRAITTEYVRQNRVIEQFCCTDTEYTSKFYTQNVSPPTGRQMLASVTMRKFMEESRMTLVWRSLNWEALPSGNREYGDETGVTIVECVTDPETGEPSSEGAIVRVYTRYMPIWEDQKRLAQLKKNLADSAANGLVISSKHELEVGEFTNRILNGTEEDIAAITESIENILLDESIGSTDDDLEFFVGALSELTDDVHTGGLLIE